MKKTSDLKIGCIGTGNMGLAILAGLADTINRQQVYIYDIDAGKMAAVADEFQVHMADSIEYLVKSSDIVLLAVKPQVISSVLDSMKGKTAGKIVVSVAAGVAISVIENVLGSSTEIVRVMPNTPCLVTEGMSVLSAGKAVDADALGHVEHIFSTIGKALILPEDLMDAVTGVSGSGPAYVFTFIQALTDGGVKMGIPRDKALQLAAQTVLGAAKMVLETGQEPIALRGKVTSPGGTTIDAVHVLDRAGFSGIVIDAVETAARKSKKLGEK